MPKALSCAGQFPGKGAAIHVQILSHGVSVQRYGKGNAILQTGTILQIGQNLITGSWAEQAGQPLVKNQTFFCHNTHEVCLWQGQFLVQLFISRL